MGTVSIGYSVGIDTTATLAIEKTVGSKVKETHSWVSYILIMKHY